VCLCVSNRDYFRIVLFYYTLKNAGLFQLKFGLNMVKPKCWVINVIKTFTVKVKVEVQILNYINPTLGFVHI